VLGFLPPTNDHWDTMSEEDRRHALTRAVANARGLQALTRDVLDSSAVDAGGLSYSWDVVDLRHEVESAVTAAHDLRPDRRVVFDPGEGPAWERADPDRIQQVLVNLLDNAAANGPPDTDIEVTLRSAGDEVEVSVVDHGPGLSEGDLERVFEKFVRGRSTVRGTGLGLYLAREIMNAHHGRIWADRAGSSGARFCFSLPLVSAPSAPAESLS
jgi:two-component system sensor histidine kinase KdpD